MINGSQSVHQNTISSGLSQHLKFLALTVSDCHTHGYGSAIIDEHLKPQKAWMANGKIEILPDISHCVLSWFCLS